MKHTDANTTLGYLITKFREFLEERDWEKYHDPKNIAESICIEAAELLQLFQWTKHEESEKSRTQASKVQQVSEELADVVMYCLSMANVLHIDLTAAVLGKLEQNRRKYPPDLYKGKAHLTQ